jgi:hypothetical protein
MHIQTSRTLGHFELMVHLLICFCMREPSAIGVVLLAALFPQALAARRSFSCCSCAFVDAVLAFLLLQSVFS